jgi:hypothetical protein
VTLVGASAASNSARLDVSRYLSSLVGMNNNPQSRTQTVKVLANLWRHNEQFLIILLDKLIAYRILDTSTVLNWVFAMILPEETYTLSPWEIIDTILTKVTRRTQHIQSRLAHEEAEHRKREDERSREKKFQTTGTEVSDRERLSENERQTELERIKALTNSLNSALREEKENFLLVFGLFVDLLGRRLAAVPRDTDEHLRHPWFRWTFGYFRDFGRKYHQGLRRFAVTLESLLFTPETDSRILAVFHEFRVVDAV